MSDRAIIVAAVIIGGAIVATSVQTRPRYALSASDTNVAWRMDTWSGQVDICAASYLPNGPLVRCGAVVVIPSAPQDKAGAPNESTPAPPSSPLESGENRSL